MSLTTGARLGQYEVLSAIGAGGMGEVYRAKDTKLNRDVAIKVLPAMFANDTERLARFTREAQTLATLNHPNFAHIRDLKPANIKVRADGTVKVLDFGLAKAMEGPGGARRAGAPEPASIGDQTGELNRSMTGGPVVSSSRDGLLAYVLATVPTGNAGGPSVTVISTWLAALGKKQ
ncbi:MAG: hypothetical protein HY048_03565 [Acidobacteria bacterium]|nr:hypothetical protein [Acidobacteriota bacterium]